jgi:levanase
MNPWHMTRRTALGLIAAAAATPRMAWSSKQTLAPNRPKYHLTPYTAWINDPQRPMFINGVWNLWVLWNADYPNGNGTTWRRYTSTDLIQWADQGVSIPKYTTLYGDVWTGSTVVDTNNTAGFGAGAIVALMTMPCNNLGGQSTARWYSIDGGVSFTFDSIVQVNPQIAGGVAPANMVFRDPSIFWYAPGNYWVMSLAEIGKLSIYTSVDLKNWVYASGYLRSDLGIMECPHLFQMHLYEPDGVTTLEDKWVLLCGANGYEYGLTTGTHYWTGTFDGITFTPDSYYGQWLDGGADFYATTIFADANALDPKEHMLAVAWNNNWDYATEIPTVGYFGQISITRQLRLQISDGLPILYNSPVAGIDSIFKGAVTGTKQIISDSTSYAFPTWNANAACWIEFTMSPVDGSWPNSIYFSLRGGDGYFTQLGFGPSYSNAFLKRDTGGLQPTSDAAWTANENVTLDFNEPVTVSIFSDIASLEIFLNGGRIAISSLTTAPLDATSLNLSASGGSVEISKMKIRSVAGHCQTSGCG